MDTGEILKRMVTDSKLEFSKHYREDVRALLSRVEELEKKSSRLRCAAESDQDNLISFVDELNHLIHRHDLYAPIPL